MVPPRAASPLVKGEAISSLGHFQHERVVNPLRRVVLRQFGAKAARLDSHHGIKVGVKVFLATEDLGSNLVFLRRYTGMFKRMVRQILEQLAERLRAVQSTAAEQLLEVRELLGPISHSWSHRKLGWQHCNTNVTHLHLFVRLRFNSGHRIRPRDTSNVTQETDTKHHKFIDAPDLGARMSFGQLLVGV
jgi:hypothetical protein